MDIAVVLRMVLSQKLALLSIMGMNIVRQAPEVTIEQGVLVGSVSADGKSYHYMGIPYGTVNDSNRFQAPLPPQNWKGVYKATKEFSCLQHVHGLVFGTEDCLALNVYVPTASHKPLPVMVYIHGGGFVMGNGGKFLYGPDFIVKHNVILVTFNYRLGVLGFLCLGIKKAPGNAGLRDQIAALRWIKTNIAAFGGDPDNVTVFGESAGGTSISFLLSSQASNGLFKRAIIQSGSSISARSLNRYPIQAAKVLVKKLANYTTQDPQELYAIISNKSSRTLISRTAATATDLYFKTEETFLPCVEKHIPGVEPVITDLPYNLLRNKYRNVSVIYGSNSREGLYLISGQKQTDKKRNYKNIYGKDLEFPSDTEAKNVDKRIREFYFGSSPIEKMNLLNLSELYTHFYYEVPAIMETELLLDNSEIPVYNYIFNYSGNRNFVKLFRASNYRRESGAVHGDDLLYLFNALIWPLPITENDQKVIDWMTTMWTNFAKFGDPTPPSSNLPVKWSPSSRNNLKFLYIDAELKTGLMPNPAAYQLWTEIYKKYRRTNISIY